MPNAATFAARSHKQAPCPPSPLSSCPSPSLCLAVKELRQWWGVGKGVFGFLISHYAGWKILVRLLVASSVFKMKNEATAACGTHQRHICVCGCMCVCTAGNLSHSLGIAPPPSLSAAACLPAALPVDYSINLIMRCQSFRCLCASVSCLDLSLYPSPSSTSPSPFV